MTTNGVIRHTSDPRIVVETEDGREVVLEMWYQDDEPHYVTVSSNMDEVDIPVDSVGDIADALVGITMLPRVIEDDS
jgi:hypothetical protein